MLRKKGFTLIELLVVISIIALLIGILLPALGAARRTANQMKNSTQLRGIVQGCVLYAQGNNDYYPGLDSNGKVTSSISFTTTTYGEADNGTYPANRYCILLNGNYFVPAYMINPQDSKATAVINSNISSAAGNTGNFSYALLALTTSNAAAGVATAPGDTRDNDWKNTTNSQAVVISDRNVGTGFTNTTARSVWTTSAGDWRGSVGWNDNHVTFETQPLVTTKYTGGLTNDSTNGGGAFGTNKGDNLFNFDTNSATGGTAYMDAGMVFQDGITMINQN